MEKLQEQYPAQTFRISSAGHTQRYFPNNKSTNKWKNVCMHNRQPHVCRLCNGSSFCEHSRMKYRCTICATGTAICEHGRIKYYCADCDGTCVCIHKIQRRSCRQCDGSAYCGHGIQTSNCKLCKGSGICEHDKKRIFCVECKGSQICEHNVSKHRCQICVGNGICKHSKRKTRCPICGGSELCKICKLSIITKDGCCVTCHPEYIPPKSGASKIACKFFDELETEVGEITHIHYDAEIREPTGSEFRLPEWRGKTVDGHIIDSNIVFEFLGNIFHGHPSQNDKSDKNHLGEFHSENFAKTEEIMKRVRDSGYEVWYVWEYDYINRNKNESLMSICRKFEGKLEC